MPARKNQIIHCKIDLEFDKAGFQDDHSQRNTKQKKETEFATEMAADLTETSVKP